MADLKISQLSDGGNSQATDEYVIARSGANYRIDGASIAAAATSVGTLSSLTVSGNTIVGAEVFRGSDSSFMRLAGGNPSATGAAVVLFGSTHATAPGRVDINATGTGTFNVSTGGVARAQIDASGNLAVDTNTLYVDATNNRVGIGTASPIGTLNVAGATTGSVIVTRSSNGTTASPVETQIIGSTFTNGSYEAGIYALNSFTNNSGNWLAFKTTDTGNTTATRMTLDASGNLGLGVTPSAWGRGKSFEVGSIGNAVWGDTGPNGIVSVSANAYLSTTNLTTGWKYAYTGPAGRYNISENVHSWYTAASGTAGNTISWTQAMTLSASGILSVTATSGTGGQINLFGDAQTTGEVTLGQGFALATDDIGYLYNRSNAAFVFGTNNTERARITSGGYFKASNTGTYLGSTGEYHEMRSDITAANGVLFVHATSASATSDGIIQSRASRNTTDNTFYAFSYYNDAAAAYKFRIADSGTATNTTGTYGTISDIKHKQDVVDAPSQWDDLKAVRFRKFRMKSDVAANPDAPYMLGVVAQELEQVSPGLIEEHPDFEEQEVTDEDGNVTTEKVQVGTTKSVKSSILLMKAAVALQEAMARIEALEARLEALEA